MEIIFDNNKKIKLSHALETVAFNVNTSYINCYVQKMNYNQLLNFVQENYNNEFIIVNDDNKSFHFSGYEVFILEEPVNELILNFVKELT